MPKIVPKSIQTCFELVLGQIFRKIFVPSVPWGVEFSKTFKKNQKSFKFPKMPKIVPKSIQTCFERVLGQTFRKIFAQFSMEGRVFENFQKNQKICKIPKMPKIVPQSIQTCFELVLGQIFRKIFLPSVPWRVEFSKMFKKFFFQNSKNAQNRSQKYPYVFRTCFGSNFLKHFCAQCSVGGRVFENFQKKKNNFKIPKMPKIFPKSIQTCLRVIFTKKNLCPVFHGGSSFRKFSKNFYFKIPKMPKSVHKSIQTCFELVLGQIF